MDDSGKSSREDAQMKPLRKRLEEARKNTGLFWETIERDYVLSWVLAGIGVNEKLQNGLISKGGTALKKCYFGEYRFSKDLDFTARQCGKQKKESVSIWPSTTRKGHISHLTTGHQLRYTMAVGITKTDLSVT